MEEISNKALFALILVSLAISVAGTILSIQKLSSMPSSSPITAAAISPNASIILTIQSAASLTFTAATINFGTGSVNASGGFSNCTLSTVGTRYGCNGFNDVTAPLTLENDGNTNLTVNLFSNVTAAQFIGGSAPVFNYNISVNETGSCLNSTNGVEIEAFPATFTTVNTTDPGNIICPKLQFQNTNDTLNIGINISIPLDASQTAKAAGLKATGTTV